jgi:Domain of unknown function (DUF4281)
VTPEQIFSIVNLVAAAAWIMLVVLPRQRWVTDIVTSVIVPMLFAIIYIGIVATTFASTPGGFSTLAAVATLFSNPWALLAGWVHYLAFDLLIGTWQVRDARERGVRHLLVVPCLILTFLLGPAGWLLYMGARSVRSSHMRQRLVEGS